MSSTATYKLIRVGVMIALVAGGAVACNYKPGSDYTANTPDADSGTRRIRTTAMPADSMNMPVDAASTLPAKTGPVTRAKFARGRASVTAPKIYATAEVAPQFPGGQRGLDNYINKNVNYPQEAIDDNVTGIVHVSFVVDERGRVTKAKVLDAANITDGLDQEALRVVRTMPTWAPGKVGGRRVKTRMELPISFQVES